MNAYTPPAEWAGRLSPGDHVCCIYELEDERRAVVVPFVRSGLERGEKVAYVADEGGAPVVLGYLREAGVDAEAAMASGQLRFAASTDVCLRGGSFDPDALLAAGREATHRALAEGYAGLRVAGETGWVLRGCPGTERLAEHEARATAALPGTKCIALCQYDRRILPPELLLAVARTHPLVAVGTALYESFYRMTPEELLGPSRTDAELRQFLRSLAAQTEKVTALRQSEERYRAIIEDVTDLICRFRPDGTITFVNGAYCRYYETSPEKVIGTCILEHVPERDHTCVLRHLASLDCRSPVAAIDNRVIRGDGQIAWQHWVNRAITDPGGNVVEIQAVGRDITERKRLEEELSRHQNELEERVAARTEELRAAYERLQEEERRKDQFLATLAHELRNPLGAISSAAYLLRLRQTSGRSLEPALDVLQHQVRHMARLLDDLLDVSRVSRGKVMLHKVPVDVGVAIRHAVEMVQPLVEASRHTLVLSLPPQPVAADADPARLEQIIANLVSNAAKYTIPEGEITVLLESEAPHGKGHQAVIRVRDTGIGISPELLPHVFDLFVQGTHHPGGSPGGLGIGLTLVRDLVELHGGAVEAHSEGIGKGSEFVVRLPAIAAAAEPAPAEPRDSLTVAAPALRVLLVEDSSDQARMLGSVLRSLGHVVRVARSGSVALRVAKAFEPHVVLLDIGLPGMDGYEVARRLRAGNEQPHPILVALTGYGQAEDLLRAREAGFSHYLTKPVDLAGLQEVLAAAAP